MVALFFVALGVLVLAFLALMAIRLYRGLGVAYEWQERRQRVVVKWQPLWGEEKRVFYIKEIKPSEMKQRRALRERKIKQPHVAIYHARNGRLAAIVPDLEEAELWVMRKLLRSGNDRSVALAAGRQLAKLLPEARYETLKPFELKIEQQVQKGGPPDARERSGKRS